MSLGKKVFSVESRSPSKAVFHFWAPSVLRGVSTRRHLSSHFAAYTYIVVQEGSPLNQNTSVVRKGCLVDISAILVDVGTIVRMPGLGINVSHSRHPVPGLLCALCVRFIISISGKTSTHIEEYPVGNRCYSSVCPPGDTQDQSRRTVLVSISLVGKRNLPSQSSITRLVISTGVSLGVPNSLCESQPLRLIRWRIRKFIFGSQQGRHAPKALIIVSQGHCVVVGHVILILAHLV